MAEPGTGPAAAPVRPGALAPYRALVGSRVAGQVGYRASFALDLLASMGFFTVELLEVYVVFHNVPVLGGLDFPAALLLFAIANLGYSLADVATGNIDTMPTLLRTGALDALMLRPLPVLAQLAAGEVELRRFGRSAVALTVLPVALAQLDVAWTPARVLLILVAPLAAAAIFAAMFVVAGAMQFWLVEGSEVTNSLVYGGQYAATFSAAVLPSPLRVFFSFVVPAAFAGYLPTLALLELPGPPWLPSWLGWTTPVMAVLVWVGALAAWRAGIRHYTSAGG